MINYNVRQNRKHTSTPIVGGSYLQSLRDIYKGEQEYPDTNAIYFLSFSVVLLRRFAYFNRMDVLILKSMQDFLDVERRGAATADAFEATGFLLFLEISLLPMLTVDFLIRLC